jgi:hypothetical protein
VARAEIRAHLVKCEEDNKEIRATLKAQDDTLAYIRKAIIVVQFLVWAIGVIGAGVEVWKAVH